MNATPNINDSTLSVKQAAEALGVNQVTLWRWTRQGLVPSHLVGGRRRYLKTAIEDIILRGTQG